MSIKFNFSMPVSKPDFSKLDNFKKIIDDKNTQFYHVTDRTDLISSTKKVYEKFKDKKSFVHIGIGGSSLGPEMLVSALAKTSTQFIFINNIDPEEIYSQLSKININETIFYFVSKSGGTAETLAALAIISNFLNGKGIEREHFHKYFVFATDPVTSELKTIGEGLGIDLLEVPTPVGGRFCVLTPVGYLPALFAGINIDELINGVNQCKKDIFNKVDNNFILNTCDFLYNLKTNKGVDQTVLMPYSSKLKSFSFWFTQLWAESLGKKVNLKNEIIHTGFTPIPGYGATDQHSQVQLFMEGPNNKALILIGVDKFSKDYSLASELKSKNLLKLSGFNLSDLMKAELMGTVKALTQNERPNLLINIERNDEFHLGYLILFFESLTALMGDYLGINPFDQPGVEAGKIYAFEFLDQLKKI